MKIIILNGSPKGVMSVTMQYMHYLEKRFPGNDYTYISAAQLASKLEKNMDFYEETLCKIEIADLVIWAFPLYYALVCSQYKRFIELLFERKAGQRLAGRYAAALSTSIHFMDNLAMDYIRAVTGDLGMNFIDGITAHMEDLQNPGFRKSFDRFFIEWTEYAEQRLPCTRLFSEIPETDYGFEPAEPAEAVPTAAGADRPSVCIVGDLESDDSSIRKMALFAAETAGGADIVDLSSFKFGPCTGCLKCGFDNVCVYEGKDEFIDIHRGRILAADIILFVGAVHDRYLSSLWQRFLERTFNYTHQPRLKGKQIGFLVSGPLAANQTMREILSAYTEVMGGSLAGFVSDEGCNPGLIAAGIRTLMQKAASRYRCGAAVPESFVGVGGMNVFRDEIFSQLRFVFQADHRYYRRHGLYNFPQKRMGRRLVTTAGVLLTRIPPMRRMIRSQLRQGMLSSLKKLLDATMPAQE